MMCSKVAAEYPEQKQSRLVQRLVQLQHSLRKRQTGYRLLICNPLFFMVGVAGFELATPCTPCKCATRLRYTP